MSVLLDRITSDQGDAVPRAATFRRTDGTLTATVHCEGVSHRVRIDGDGGVELLDHDRAALAMLRALGNDETLPCQRVEGAAGAAWEWLYRRLRLTAPAGTWSETTKRWSSWEERPCCDKHRSGRRARETEARPAVRDNRLVEPGALLPHSRSIQHVATICGAEVSDVDKIARWLCAHQAVTANPRDLPVSSAERIRALLPDGATDQQVQNLWSMGVTLSFLTAVAEAHPTAAEIHSGVTGDYGFSFTTDYVRRVMKWWRAGVPTEWLLAVAEHARAHWPARRSERYDHGSWVHRIPDWIVLDAEQIGDYLAAGIRTGLPTLAAENVTPGVAAEFRSIVAEHGGVASLATWLKDGYDVATAFEVVRAMPTAYPLGTYALKDLRKKMSREHGGYPSGEEEMRLRAVGALARTPGWTIRWWQTGLPLTAIAQAMADKVSPARAVARAQRA